MPAQDLYVSILPDGFLSLEWLDTEEELSQTRIALRQDLYRRYQQDYHQFFLHLGRTDTPEALCEGLDYFRSFSRLFLQNGQAFCSATSLVAIDHGGIFCRFCSGLNARLCLIQL